MPVLSSLESIYTSSDASKHSQAARDRLQGVISKEPTDANVLEISGMTHNENDRKEIQKMIYRGLRPAGTSMPHEIYHVLLLIQKCLPVASPDFKNFCVGINHLVEPFRNWTDSEVVSEPQIHAKIRNAARSVSETINDVSRAESQSGGTRASGEVKHPSQILDLGKEQVAKMTFQSQTRKHILKRLDARLDLKFSDGKTTKEIVQALTLVHHCFIWGSPEFVDHYRVKKATFNILDQHRNSQVRSHAKPIVSLLDDQSRLKRERQACAMSAS